MEIISILRTIKDPRREHLREHSFECIFYIAMAAVIGGAEAGMRLPIWVRCTSLSSAHV